MILIQSCNVISLYAWDIAACRSRLGGLEQVDTGVQA